MPIVNRKLDPRFMGLILFLICVISTGLIFHETTTALVSRWLILDESYGHGLLTAACSLYLCCAALVRPGRVLTPPVWYAAPLLVLLSLLIAIANSIGVDLLPQVLLPIMIWLAFALVAGIGPAGRIIVPLGLLYFAIPVWDYLNDGLVALTSEVVGFMVSRSSIPAYITGNSIFIPSGEIIIASGCSGLRYLIIGLFLGVLGSYLNFVSFRREALLLAGFLFVSLLANWIRVYGITMVAYVSEMQSPLIHDHEFAGWVVFLICISPLMYAGARGQSVQSPDAVREVAPAMSVNNGRPLRALLVAWLSLALGPFWLGQTAQDDLTTIRISDLAGIDGSGWITRTYTPAAVDWQPRIVEPVQAQVEQFQRGDGSVLVYQYLYTRDAGRREVLPYVNTLYDRDNWAIEHSGGLHGYRLLELVNKLSQKKIRVAYRFNVGGLITSSYLVAKLYQFPALLLRRPYALLTAVVVECENSCEQADTALRDFIEGH